MTTTSVEDYLKCVYVLEQRHGRAKTKALAQMLGISLPSVTSMVQSLARDGLLEYAKYQGASLSDEGRLAALKVIRKHRLIELFLVDTLGYSWDEVHEEAERLEHAVSDRLAARIEHHLSYPQADPHGDPIPDAHGRLPAKLSKPLDTVAVGLIVKVTRVLDQSPEVLRYLDRVGFTLGATVHIEEQLPFEGQLMVAPTGGEPGLLLSRSLAARILVVEV